MQQWSPVLVFVRWPGAFPRGTAVTPCRSFESPDPYHCKYLCLLHTKPRSPIPCLICHDPVFFQQREQRTRFFLSECHEACRWCLLLFRMIPLFLRERGFLDEKPKA